MISFFCIQYSSWKKIVLKQKQGWSPICHWNVTADTSAVSHLFSSVLASFTMEEWAYGRNWVDRYKFALMMGPLVRSITDSGDECTSQLWSYTCLAAATQVHNNAKTQYHKYRGSQTALTNVGLSSCCVCSRRASILFHEIPGLLSFVHRVD